MSRNEPLVIIATFASSFEASLAKGALAARGIDACVPDEERGTFSLNRGRFHSALVDLRGALSCRYSSRIATEPSLN